MHADFECPKCRQANEAVPVSERRDVVCARCGRRWRLMPDLKSIMGTTYTLTVHGTQHGHSAEKPGD